MQYGTVGTVFYFPAALNNTAQEAVDSSAGPVVQIRRCGDGNATAPVQPDNSATAVLLTSTEYGSGTYEIQVDSTGLTSSRVFSVYTTFDIGDANPNAVVGQFATFYQPVNVVSVNHSTDAANNLEDGLAAEVRVTCAAGCTSSVLETNLTEATADHYNGRTCVFITGALAAQATDITDYSSNGVTTVTALTEAPANGDIFLII